MRNPDNIKKVQINNEQSEILVIQNLPEYDIEDYDIFSDKDFKKYIDDLKRVVRGSHEYRKMIRFVRENMNMNLCSFYKNVNNVDTTKIKIEIHHEPLSLHDICIIVFNKRNTYHESLEIEMVAKEVMYLHYKLMVGLIPLSETVHELVTNEFLFVPVDAVYGNYMEFVRQYEDFMTAEQLDTLDRIFEYTAVYNENNGDDEQMGLLSKRYIYVDASGSYELPQLSVIADMISKKITELKQPHQISDNRDNNTLINPISFEEE